MQEKQNNAVEKAEKATKSPTQVKKEQSQSGQTASKKPKKSTRQKDSSVKKTTKNDKKSERAKRRELLKEKKRIVAQQKEKAQAEKRIELARIKAHKKAEKEKAKATALREKNRRKAELKEKKQQIKAEKQARKEALKRENKKDKQERIKAERLARLQEKKRVREQKAQERQLKREQKQQNRQRKDKKRASRSRDRKGVGGWIAAVISLGVATLVLASVLTFTFLMPTMSDNMLEASYSKSFYDTVAQVDNIDLNLSKAMATSDSGAIQQYLVDTAINSELAENDLQQLPLQDESKYYTTKLINQIGDYAKYLNKKLIDGESLTEEDMQGLTQLYNANRTLKQSLKRMVDSMGTDFAFASLMDGADGNLIISGFNELQNLSVKYPELIYDGPFSDGQVNRQIKGLSGEEIDDNFAVKEFSKIFAEYSLSDIESVGMTSGNVESYNVQGLKDGDILYAQISKKGGKLLEFSYAGDCNEVKIEKDDAVDSALDFMQSIGLENMTPVWINLANNVYTINFAYEQGGVIVYSDLVKVRVCGETGTVIGIEATTYYTNHTDRVIETAKVSEEQAEQKVSSNIDIETVRLAVVPIGSKTEKLCYEFSGTFDGSTYYVYIDAITGRQVEMFKVVAGTEGELLM